MMQAVWKFDLEVPAGKLEVPLYTQPLSCGMQVRSDKTEVIVIWARVLTDIPSKEKLKYICLNTGLQIAEDEIPLGQWTFLGTVTSSNGVVWHVFYSR